jgi:hypothetical protein
MNAAPQVVRQADYKTQKPQKGYKIPWGSIMAFLGDPFPQQFAPKERSVVEYEF